MLSAAAGPEPRWAPRSAPEGSLYGRANFLWPWGGVEGPPRGTPAGAGSGGVLAGAPRTRVGLRGEKCWKGCGGGDGRRREGVKKEQGSGWEKDTRPRGAEVPWGKPAGRPAGDGRSAGREGGGSGPGPRGRRPGVASGQDTHADALIEGALMTVLHLFPSFSPSGPLSRLFMGVGDKALL